MIYVMLGYLFIWYAGALVAITVCGIDAVTALGIGTAGGVFLSAFKDAWQFMWRKTSPKEEK
jgi:hypothetical protein